MAILGDLLVQGRSRFLQKIYAASLDIGEDTTIAGTLTLSKTNDAVGTSNNSPALVVGGTATTAHLELDSNEIMAKTNGTTAADIYVNPDGGVIYLGKSGIKTQVQGNLQVQGTSTFTGASTHSGNLTVSGTTSLAGTSVSSDLNVANNAKVNGVLTVEEEIRSPKWIIDNIANLGGEFIIAPTIVCENNTSVNISGPSNNLYTITVTDGSITSDTFGGITWSTGSVVKVSGTINDTVLVSINGTMTRALNQTIGTIQFTVSSSNITLTAGTYTGTKVKNLHIMMYKVSNVAPVGIFMTSYGQSHYPYIDIYSGTTSGSFYSPTTRLGYLNGLTDESGNALKINNISPTGWGLYTSNGYFSGTIVSTSGKIGGFTLNTNAIYNGTTSLASTNAGVYLGINGIRNYKDSTHYVNIQEGVITALGANITGAITATSGEIGGFAIDSSSIHTKNVAVTSNADNSISLSSADFTRTINGTSRAGLRFAIGDKFGITGDGILYTNGANITNINASNISTGTVSFGVLPESVKNENIEVGGRNLLLWSSPSAENLKKIATETDNNVFAIEDGYSCYKITGAGTSGNQYASTGRRLVQLDANTQYVYSALIKLTTIATNVNSVGFNFGSLGHFSIINDASTASDKTHEDLVSERIYSPSTISIDKWTKIQLVFTTNSLNGSWFGLYPKYNLGTDYTLYIRDQKLEKGNMATDWTPAPEDMATQSSLESAKSEIKATTDGITSIVSKISSAKYLTSAYLSSGWTLANIRNYAAEGSTQTFTVVSTEDVRVGDTVYIKGKDNTRVCNVCIKGTVTQVVNATQLVMVSHGYEDVLPVDTIKSTINQSSDSVKIQAKHVEIDGAAIFSNSAFKAAADAAYDAKGSASAVQTNLDNLEIGGRNLWILSEVTPGYENAGNFIGSAPHFHMERYYEVAPGDSITYQHWNPELINNTSNSNRICWYDSSKAKISSIAVPTVSEAHGTYIAQTYIAPDNAAYVRFGALYDNGESSVRVKFERGNKATDWTPAPEDVNVDISAAESNAKSFATDTVNNLSIGGRNLLRNSLAMNLGASSWANGVWRLAGNADMAKSRIAISDGPLGQCYGLQLVGTQSTTSNASCYGMDGVPRDVGEDYIISMFARVVGGGIAQAGFAFNSANIEDTNTDGRWAGYYTKTLDTNGKWTRIWVHWKSTASSGNIYIGGAATDSSSKTIQMCLVKIEKGTKPTDWTAAPEDVSADISAAESSAKEYADTKKTEAIAASYANMGFKYKKDIIVYGDSDKYYPVYLNNDQTEYSQASPHEIVITRGYSELAPNDWNPSSSAHHGSLNLRLRWNYGGWGGATYVCQIYDFSEMYSTILGDVLVGNVSGMCSTVYLRGGGTTGAIYHIYSEVALDTVRYGGTFPHIGTDTGEIFMESGQYNWKVASPLTTPNRAHILSLAAVVEEQYIYRSVSSGVTSVDKIETWVTTNTEVQNNWTTKRPTYNSSYPVLFIAKQRKMAFGLVTCTTPVKDDTTTVIDGGHITTGTIDTNRLNADTIKSNIVQTTELNADKITSGTIAAARIAAGSIAVGKIDATSGTFNTANIPDLNASKITAGDISAARIKANVISAINSLTAGQIDADRINAANLHVNAANIDGSLTIGDVDGLQTALNGKQATGDYATKTQAQGYATTAVNNLSIGGRNLLQRSFITTYSTGSNAGVLNTDEYISSGTVIYSRGTNQNEGFYISRYSEMDDSTNYVISFKAKVVSGSITQIYIYATAPTNITATADTSVYMNGSRIGTFNSPISISMTTGTYYDFRLEFATPSDISSGSYVGEIIQWNKTVSTAFEVEMTNLKWEKGTKATDWSPAPEDVDANILTAAQTATNYITHVDNNGITIHPSSTTNNRVAINANGMQIYKGNVDIASYGDTARIGKTNSSRFLMNASSLQAYNSSNKLYFEVSSTGIKYGTDLSSTSTTTTVASTIYADNKASAAQSAAISAAATDATNKANAAAKTATNYISADANGISIHMANESNTYQRQTSDSTTFYVGGKKRSQVGADGLHVYVDSTEDEVANFGATARIGKASEKHLEVAKTALAFTDGSISESPGATNISGNTLFSVNTQGSYTGDPFDNASALARGVVLNINGLTVTSSWLRYRSSNNSTLLTAYETNSGPKIAIGRPYNENASDNTSNVVFDYHSMQMVDKEGTTYFYVSDLRDSSGKAEITEEFIGDGSTKSFSFSATATDTEYTVTVSDGSGGTITKRTNGIIFATAPTSDATITVVYYTTDTDVKAYTLGIRGDGALGPMSVAEGYGTIASGRLAHAEGYGSVASGVVCHAEGYNTTAIDYHTHAEGHGTTANRMAAHAEGWNTTASGNYSHSEGYESTASRQCCHAEGYKTTAGYFYTHAQNKGTVASACEAQTAIGKFNDNGSANAFEIGNGTSDNARSNAATIDWNGNYIGQAMAGIIQMFAGSTPPTGWLLCHGQAISRTDYATLFAAIGTTWGSGNGSTTFNVPDLRGRAPIGAGTGSGLTARTLAAKGGSENIQAHTHAFTQPTVKTELKFEKNAASGSALNRVAGSNHNNPSTTTTYTATVTGGAVGAVSGATTGSAGNMPPFAVINFIICTGKTS